MPETLLKLPERVATVGAITALLQEVGSVNEQLIQNRIRAKQTNTEPAEPDMSGSFREVMRLNELSLDNTDLTALADGLKYLRTNAPTVRLVFAVEPSTSDLQKIVTWFREASGLPVLIKVGIQPQIAAGCIVQTPNHSFDLSLRKRLLDKAPALAEVTQRV